MKKKSIYLMVVAMFFVFACNSDSGDDNANTTDIENTENVKEEDKSADVSSKTNSTGYYGVETGVIEYEMNIMGMMTKMTTYFKDNGAVQCVDATVNVMGKSLKTRVLTLGDFVYMFDESTKTGTKTKNSDENIFDYKNVDFEKLSEAELTKNNVKKEGTEVVLGKKCTIYSIQDPKSGNVKVWIWKNIFFKMEVSEMNVKTEMKATKFEKNPSFPAGIFEIPSGYKIKELNFDDTNKQMEELLKKK